MGPSRSKMSLMPLQSQSQHNSEHQRNFQQPSARNCLHRRKSENDALVQCAATGSTPDGTQTGAIHGDMNLLRPSQQRRASALREASELSDCINVQPMPSLDQSVLRKRGLEESQRAGQGDKVMPIFNSSQRETRGGVHRGWGMGLRRC